MNSQSSPQEKASKVLVISAEPSSNLYAERIMEEATGRNLPIQFWGVGNQRMADLGMSCLGRAEDMAVMGLQEVVRHYSFIKGVYNQVLEELERSDTKVALLMDYAEFNLKLAKDLHERGVKVLFYIAPQIWAWRRGRVRHVNKYVDELLCIFPFEEKFYGENGVKTKFVGHPLLDEIKDEYLTVESSDLKKKLYGLNNQEAVLGLMPGSRKSELSLNFRSQIESAKLLKNKYPNLQIVTLAAPSMDLNLVRSYLLESDPEISIVQDEPFLMLQAVDFALVASGTATLVTGLMQVPMIVMYKMKPITAFLMKLLISKNNPFFAMINLIFDREIVPERFQQDASPESLFKLMDSKFFDESEYMKTKNELKELPSLLGSKGATKRVLSLLESYL